MSCHNDWMLSDKRVTRTRVANLLHVRFEDEAALDDLRKDMVNLDRVTRYAVTPSVQSSPRRNGTPGRAHKRSQRHGPAPPQRPWGSSILTRRTRNGNRRSPESGLVFPARSRRRRRQTQSTAWRSSCTRPANARLSHPWGRGMLRVQVHPESCTSRLDGSK